jgi:hypothetical protein
VFLSGVPIFVASHNPLARLTWPGNGQSYLAAMEASCYIGVATAITAGLVLLRKLDAQHTSD